MGKRISSIQRRKSFDGYLRGSSNLSFLRRQEDGFTFEVQQMIAKDLSRRLKAEAFSGRVIILARHGQELGLWQRCEVCLPG